MLDLVAPLVVPNTTKIVLLSLDGLGGRAPAPAGPAGAGGAGAADPAPARDGPLGAGARAAAEPRGARPPGGVRPAPPRRARHHAGQRSRPPGAVRLRPAPVPGRPRRARGPRDRGRPARGGRARGRPASRPALGPHPPGARPAAAPRARARPPGPGDRRARQPLRGGGAPPAARRRAGPHGPAPPGWPAPRPAPANMVLLRGFDQLPTLPRFPEVFGLRSAAIAAYPMYRGLARLVGMEVLKTGGAFADEVATLREHREDHDFFFVHYKDTDKAGEDGDFDAKVEALERFDGFVPAIRDLRPDVLVVTGDHATPSILAAHGRRAGPPPVA